MADLVIFDCDGVLVDSETIAARVISPMLGEIGVEMTEAECLRELAGTWWPDARAIIEARLDGPLPEGFYARYAERRDAVLAAEVRATDGVVEAIAGVGVPVCVASNAAPEKMELVLTKTGLMPLFDGHVFSAREVERGKPAPDLFLHVAERMGAEPAGCVVVEDSVYGAIAARAAGMRALGFCERGQEAELRAEGAETFAAMSELPRLIASGP